MMRRILVFLVAAFGLRCALFGNPVIHVDEQFYLLVGDRFLHGALPYVDIWDRKPVGLFVLFAGIRLFGGDGIVAYQVVATVFAGATALFATRIADRLTSRDAATAAGLVYLVWLMIFDGAGGQSPIFYDLPMAAAALIVVDLLTRPDATHPRWRGVAVMALVGIALQLKYTVVFEGIFLGLTMLVCRYRRGASVGTLALDTLAWSVTALIPTLAAFAVYAAIGQGHAFLFANFLSIFDRGADGSTAAQVGQVLVALAGLLPLIACAIVAARRVLADETRRTAALFLIGWVAFACLAIVVVGTYRAQYFLPLLLPLSMLAAPALVDRRIAAAVLAIGIVSAGLVVRDHVARRGNAGQMARLVALIGQRPPGCLFVFSSEPILYHLTQSCLPTRYVFRSHLAQRREARAIGVDQLGEIRRVLDSRPGVIVVRTSKDNADPAAEAMLRATLQSRYRRVGAVEVGELSHTVYRLQPRTP